MACIFTSLHLIGLIEKKKIYKKKRLTPAYIMLQQSNNIFTSFKLQLDVKSKQETRTIVVEI